jgi:hypothetical protein
MNDKETLTTDERARKQRVAELGDQIGAYLQRIAGLYKAPVRVTLIVRNPAKPDGSGDTILMDDDPESAIKALRSLMADPHAEIYPNAR